MGGNDLPTVLCLWGEVVKFYDIKQLNRETTELTEYTSTLSHVCMTQTQFFILLNSTLEEILSCPSKTGRSNSFTVGNPTLWNLAKPT